MHLQATSAPLLISRAPCVAQAIATSLIVVGVTALFALIPHARRGGEEQTHIQCTTHTVHTFPRLNRCTVCVAAVEWRIAAIFAPAAVLGAYAGGLTAALFTGKALVLMFAALMDAVGIAMFRGMGALQAAALGDGEQLPFGHIVLEGLVVGGVTGLVGAGGGFLIVPALVLLGGVEMHKAVWAPRGHAQATYRPHTRWTVLPHTPPFARSVRCCLFAPCVVQVGTSLTIVTLKCFSAFAGYAAHVSIDAQLTATLTASSVLGSVLSAAISGSIPETSLRKGFALFVLVSAGYMIWQQAGPEPALAATAVAFALVCTVEQWWPAGAADSAGGAQRLEEVDVEAHPSKTQEG